MNETTQDLIIEADSLISVLLDSTASPHSIDNETSRHGITLILIEARERLNSALLLMSASGKEAD